MTAVTWPFVAESAAETLGSMNRSGTAGRSLSAGPPRRNAPCRNIATQNTVPGYGLKADEESQDEDANRDVSTLEDRPAD